MNEREDPRDREIIAELKPQPQDIVFHKRRPDGFIGTDLDLMLRSNGIKTILIGGVATEGGIEGDGAQRAQSWLRCHRAEGLRRIAQRELHETGAEVDGADVLRYRHGGRHRCDLETMIAVRKIFPIVFLSLYIAGYAALLGAAATITLVNLFYIRSAGTPLA